MCPSHRKLSDDDSDGPLQAAGSICRSSSSSVSACAGVVASTDSSWAYAESGDGVASLHEMQMHSGGAGPIVAETLEVSARPGGIDSDAAAETRWPEVCQAMTAGGLRSCLVLPLRTDRRPGAALALYGREADSFAGSDHDIALLFAAQGGVAVRNAALYSNGFASW